MTALEIWLTQATRGLSKDGIAQVGTEIRQHYESARDAALSRGASAGDAEQLALAELGDAKLINWQYRKVLLTSAEARVLREGNWEARGVCARSWLRWLVSCISVAACCVAVMLFLRGAIAAGSTATGIGLLLAAPALPIYTPERARVFRCLKWLLLVGMVILAFGPDLLKWFWLVASCLWPMAWIEWTRISLRRKMPVAKWPRQLYL